MCIKQCNTGKRDLEGCNSCLLVHGSEWYTIEIMVQYWRLYNVHCATGAASHVTEIWGNGVWRKVVHQMPSIYGGKCSNSVVYNGSCGTGEWRKVLRRVRWFRLKMSFALEKMKLLFLCLSEKTWSYFHFAEDFVFPLNFATNFSFGFNDMKITKNRQT